MRIRKLLTAAFLVGTGLVAFGGAAHAASAQEAPTTTLKEKNEECVKLLEKGKDVDDCQKAPSLILPATNELIWGGISFAVLLGLISKFAWPGIKKGMEGRTERIRGDLSAAEDAKADAQSVLDDYKAQLADAKNESARIIEEARQQADALKKDQEQRLQTELAEMRTRATADVESAKNQAIADLRTEVANLAIGAAEVVVQRNLDRETQSQLVENYITQVASRSN
ncbi:MAG: F0F1 ATP synthase subunit B [Acidimicrobiales bacterium]